MKRFLLHLGAVLVAVLAIIVLLAFNLGTASAQEPDEPHIIVDYYEKWDACRITSDLEILSATIFGDDEELVPYENGSVMVEIDEGVRLVARVMLANQYEAFLVDFGRTGRECMAEVYVQDTCATADWDVSGTGSVRLFLGGKYLGQYSTQGFVGNAGFVDGDRYRPDGDGFVILDYGEGILMVTALLKEERGVANFVFSNETATRVELLSVLTGATVIADYAMIDVPVGLSMFGVNDIGHDAHVLWAVDTKIDTIYMALANGEGEVRAALAYEYDDDDDLLPLPCHLVPFG
ncbi:hypothetical protein C4564_05280 [Candidatus Microgenomates bacterium]|nr:MAG: hypothetical protein C4564_05280 [Candidatus Microgenomates bacterium]